MRLMGVWLTGYPVYVKTTVELPDELLRAAQRTARREGTTVKSLLEEGLRLALARHLETAVSGLRDASVDGNGLRSEFRDERRLHLVQLPVRSFDALDRGDLTLTHAVRQRGARIHGGAIEDDGVIRRAP